MDKEIVEDDFGSSASAVCPICGCRAVYVCRPGDIRCGVCYDGNSPEYYTGAECEECGMDTVHNGKCLCCNITVLYDEKMKGIKEVVEWIKENVYWGYPNDILKFEAKLKEWGMSKE